MRDGERVAGMDKRYVLARIKVDERGCWMWTGATNNRGYPIGNERGKSMAQVVVTLWRGHVWQKGQTADHTCRRGRESNKPCLNPDHIRIVSNRVNQHHRSDAMSGSMAWRRLRVARALHDDLVRRMRERMWGWWPPGVTPT